MNFLSFVSCLIFCSLCGANELCYLGDSQSASKGTLFQSLESTLAAYGTIKSGMAVCGAPIAGYLGNDHSGCKYKRVTHLSISDGVSRIVNGRGTTSEVSKLCSRTDTVIVQLGDNNLSDPQAAAKDAAVLADKIVNSGKKCVWIGPASIGGSRCLGQRRQKKAVSEAIKRILASHKCTFIDSYSATDSQPPPSKDPMCIHYPGLYNIWANVIKESLANALRGNSVSQQGGAENLVPSAIK
jgi:hypothetical protein